jgi:hypothetical protein
MKPLEVDLCCGLGGWTHGLLAEGWNVLGFDIERHQYGEEKYPAQLVIQDIRTIDGTRFRGTVSLVVASPPCTEFSYMAMPWKRGKQIAAALRGQGEFPKAYKGSRTIAQLTELFDACVRIGREAGCPTIIENVRGAQPWVGRARWFFGSFGLWGDVPALMPITQSRRMKSKISCAPRNFSDRVASTPEEAHALHYRLPGQKNNGGSWFNIGSPGQKEVNRNPVHELAASGFKTSGMNWSNRELRGQDFTRIAGCQAEGVKQYGSGREWFAGEGKISRMTSSKSNARKATSAQIAKIPRALAMWIARVYYPRDYPKPLAAAGR